MRSRRSESPFDTYLREIRGYPLLGPGEEKRLARLIQRASPRSASWHRRATARRDAVRYVIEQETMHQRASRAREVLTLHNLRLVVAEAKRWGGRGLMLPDLVAEGNVGLYHAVELFDPARDVRFSTYATWWIRQAIRRALVNTVRTVRIPRHMAQDLARWRAWARRFEQREGRPPDPEEVERAMPGTDARRRFLRRVYESAGLSGATVSLDALFDEDRRLPDARVARPGEEEFGAAEVARMRRALEGLEGRESEVLRLRYGIAQGGAPMTLREVGRALSISRERVRQIERQALERLRARLGPA